MRGGRGAPPVGRVDRRCESLARGIASPRRVTTVGGRVSNTDSGGTAMTGKAREHEVRIMGLGLAALALLAALAALWVASAVGDQLRAPALGRCAGDARARATRSGSASSISRSRSGLVATSDAPDGPRRTTSTRGGSRQSCSAEVDPRRVVRLVRLAEPAARVGGRPEAVDAVVETRQEEPLVGERPRIGVGPAGREAHRELERARGRCRRVFGNCGMRRSGRRLRHGAAAGRRSRSRPCRSSAARSLEPGPRQPVRRAEVDVPVVVAVAAPDDVALRHRLARRAVGLVEALRHPPAAAPVAADGVDDERRRRRRSRRPP